MRKMFEERMDRYKESAKNNVRRERERDRERERERGGGEQEEELKRDSDIGRGSKSVGGCFSGGRRRRRNFLQRLFPF